MQIELRSLKIYPKLSEETICFTADLYVDGRKTASLRDSGTGGAVEIHPFPNMRSLLTQAEEWANALPPDTTSSGWVLPMNLEAYISRLVNAADEERLLKKECKKATVFHLHSQERGQYSVVEEEFSPDLEAWLQKEYGTDLQEIINKRFT